MSSGQKHSGITIGLSGGIAAGAISSYFLQPLDILVMSICCLVGIVLTPDKDLDAGAIDNMYIRNKLGGFVGWLWWVLWTPYRTSIKHRSFWSHTPVIGTAIRLSYLVFPIIILILPIRDQRPNYLLLIPKALLAQFIVLPLDILLCGFYIVVISQTPELDWLLVGLSGFCGLALADLGHFLADL